jgi:hypothetical protein
MQHDHRRAWSAVVTPPGGTTEQGGPFPDGDLPVAPTPFDLLFLQAYPAAVGLARRVLDRDQVAPEGSGAMAAEVATEALTRARVHRLSDTDGSMHRIMGWVADLCVGRLVGHPGRVALPEGAQAEDLLPEDLLDLGVGAEWRLRGLPLAELQMALVASRRRDRRAGLVCLGAGLTPLHTAALLGLDIDAVQRALRRVGVQLADRRRIDAGLDLMVDAPAEDVA